MTAGTVVVAAGMVPATAGMAAVVAGMAAMRGWRRQRWRLGADP